MIEDIQSVFDLPFATLVVLAAGFAAYRVAFTGKKKGHGTIDIVFITVVFAALAKFVFELVVGQFELLPSGEVAFKAAAAASLAAVAAAVLAAGFWRRWGENWIMLLLRTTRVSYSDGNFTAWDQIRVDTTIGGTQLVVRKKDGSQVMCADLWECKDLPFGPSIYGEDGSIALYVTAFRSGPSENWIDNDFEDTSYGVALTYIPAEQISEIEVRNLKP